jgi:hypothetical protein
MKKVDPYQILVNGKSNIQFSSMGAVMPYAIAFYNAYNKNTKYKLQWKFNIEEV